MRLLPIGGALLVRLKPLVLSLGAVILTSGSPGIAHAQQAARSVPVTPGSRVRVRAAGLVAPLIANFLEQRGDTLVFIEEGTGRGVWSFSFSQIERLETTAGEAGRNSNQMARSATIGAGAGFIAGVLFAASVRPSEDGKTYDRPVTGLVGALVGGGIGAFIGSRQKSEQWIRVPLPSQLSVFPDGRGGLRVGITLR
jgi:uncharacterized membrane protein YeaQ/YmgE (transglycosylase-associated protein family)